MSLHSRYPAPLRFNREGLSDELLLRIYAALLKPRLIEERMQQLVRQGRVSKWFSGMGQEATAVGCTLALEADEYILPQHRNLGVFTSRGVELEKLFAQFQGKTEGFTRGRDRTFHFGSKEHRIIGMISHLGSQLGVADGAALADLLRKRRAVTAVFCGDGTSSEGDFHEALNLAAVWSLPVIFIIENNGYSLSTPLEQQYACSSLSHRAEAYGMSGQQVDGNNVLGVFKAVKSIAESMRKDPKPALIECLSFRVRGHEESIDNSFVPSELVEKWKQRDPVVQFEQFLLSLGILTKEIVASARAEIEREIEDKWKTVVQKPEVTASHSREEAAIFERFVPEQIAPSKPGSSPKRYIDAINDTLFLAMARHENLVLLGQDIADFGGVFKATKGLAAQFGYERVRNTPMCESAVAGAALGLSINGCKVIMEFQFADFATCAFSQIVNNIATAHYRWGQFVDVVFRLPAGGSVAAGPFHSSSKEAWFAHVPGLKIVYPAFPYDAKGLLAAAIEDPNPVLFFEHKALYRGDPQVLPDDYFSEPLGKAKLIKQGEQLSIVSYGLGVHWALEYLNAHGEISADLLDLRSICPLDFDALRKTIQKTGRVLILHEANLCGGFGAELAAFFSSECFECLDAPVMRCASLNTPVPFAKALEENYLAAARLERCVSDLLNY